MACNTGTQDFTGSGGGCAGVILSRSMYSIHRVCQLSAACRLLRSLPPRGGPVVVADGWGWGRLQHGVCFKSSSNVDSYRRFHLFSSRSRRIRLCIQYCIISSWEAMIAPASCGSAIRSMPRTRMSASPGISPVAHSAQWEAVARTGRPTYDVPQHLRVFGGEASSSVQFRVKRTSSRVASGEPVAVISLLAFHISQQQPSP